MICSNCKKDIDIDSVYCQYCGHKMNDTSDSKERVNQLWKKFVEYSYEADNEKRTNNRKIIPENIKEICNRFSINIFDALKSEYQEIKELPFSVVEHLRSYYYLSCEDGFWLYLSEKILNNEKLSDKKVDVEKVIDQWQKTINDNEKFKKHINEDFVKVFQANEDLEFDLLLKQSPQLKNLATKTVDQIKNDLFKTTLWIYLCSDIADHL